MPDELYEATDEGIIVPDLEPEEPTPAPTTPAAPEPPQYAPEPPRQPDYAPADPPSATVDLFENPDAYIQQKIQEGVSQALGQYVPLIQQTATARIADSVSSESGLQGVERTILEGMLSQLPPQQLSAVSADPRGRRALAAISRGLAMEFGAQQPAQPKTAPVPQAEPVGGIRRGGSQHRFKEGYGKQWVEDFERDAGRKPTVDEMRSYGVIE